MWTPEFEFEFKYKTSVRQKNKLFFKKKRPGPARPDPAYPDPTRPDPARPGPTQPCSGDPLRILCSGSTQLHDVIDCVCEREAVIIDVKYNTVEDEILLLCGLMRTHQGFGTLATAPKSHRDSKFFYFTVLWRLTGQADIRISFCRS